jgi:hypothetical protein
VWGRGNADIESAAVDPATRLAIKPSGRLAIKSADFCKHIDKC